MGDLELDSGNLIAHGKLFLVEINGLGSCLPRPEYCQQQKKTLHESKSRAGGHGGNRISTC